MAAPAKAPKRGRGRPSAFKPEYVEQATKLCTLGATDADLSEFFKVSIVTIWSWQRRYPEFLNALKMGKEAADERVERSLYHKANGYTFESEKVFQFQGQIVRAKTREHVPPDTTAAIFWLKNRQPANWRDRSEHLHRHEGVQALSDAELEHIAAGRGDRTGAAPHDTSKLN